MKKIEHLPQHLISKIAAGEVVERPGSVIKELIENALDAKATNIDISLEGGGAKKIVVKDNGEGMSTEDILLCFLAHTTSKISSEEDLFNIQSFGFRGEALASIAAVSLMTIKSREHGTEFGTIVELNSGKLIENHPIGMPEGTEIIIESLFHSTPARKKFLRESAAEIRYISELVTRLCLSYPLVGFRLTHNEKIILDLPSGQDLKERIAMLLGSFISRDIIPLHYENRYARVHGFIARPQIASRSREHQYIFVNGRSVIDPVLSETIKESYGSLLEPRANPPFIIFISLPFENVDVNIHPRKEEVAFVYPDKIKLLVSEAVIESLKKHDLTYKEHSPGHDYGMDHHTASMLRELIVPWNVKSEDGNAILQIKNLYLVTMTDKGLLIVDQHAAHERILFEQFKDAFTSAQENPLVSTLPEPCVFDISVSEALTLKERLPFFQKLGFELEVFGAHSFKLSAVPEVFKKRNHVALITEVLQDLKQEREKTLDRETERTLAFLACRTAIKSGDPLDVNERKNLIEKLLQFKTLYTCPHGRPTHIEMPLSHLDKMFKRS